MLSAALLTGCVSDNGAERQPDASAEAERIAKVEPIAGAEPVAEAERIAGTVAAWLEPYKSGFGLETERDGDTIYVRGRFGELPSLFSKLDFVFQIDAQAREVACFAYLPAIVPEERRMEMSEFVFRGEWEYGISTASLVLDDDGRVRCQAWTPFSSFAAQPAETRWRLMGAVVDKLWSFSEGVAEVALGADAAAAASKIRRIAAFEGGDDALHLKKAADADTDTVLRRCFGEDAEMEIEGRDDNWLAKLSGRDGDTSVGTIRARFEELARDAGSEYDVLPYALIVMEGMVWNVCTVPEECPEGKRSEMAEFLMKLNQGLKCAQFGMDFDTGKIWSHYAVPVDAIPEHGESAAKNPYGVFIKAQTVQNIVRHAGELRAILRSDGN